MTSDAGSTAARWAADEPLRQGMARVRNTAQALVHFEHGRLDEKQVAMHADELRAAVDFIFAECRLAPEPDAALHPLLAQLIGVSKALKELPTDPAPIAELHAALARYAQLFDESGVTPAGG